MMQIWTCEGDLWSRHSIRHSLEQPSDTILSLEDNVLWSTEERILRYLVIPLEQSYNIREVLQYWGQFKNPLKRLRDGAELGFLIKDIFKKTLLEIMRWFGDFDWVQWSVVVIPSNWQGCYWWCCMKTTVKLKIDRVQWRRPWEMWSKTYYTLTKWSYRVGALGVGALEIPSWCLENIRLVSLEFVLLNSRLVPWIR